MTGTTLMVRVCMVVTATAAVLAGCAEEERPLREFVGNEPEQVIGDARLIISDAGVTTAVLESPLVKMFESMGYTVMEDSLRLEFYNEEGEHTSTLTSQSGEVWGLLSAVDSLKAIGDVRIRSTERNAVLTADAVVWVAEEQMIYGDGVVTLDSEEGYERGTGFVAKDDLSEYRFTGPVSGEFQVEDRPLFER